MRKLVTYRTVSKIEPISGADKIELAFVDGWQCVVKKGEFSQSDVALYFEIDSWLSASDPRFSFLEKQFRKNAVGELGARLRTIKLRGALSQGLLLPVANFPELADLPCGADLAAALGVTKWEPPMPACLAGNAKGSFPGFIPKTDQERIQNVPHYLDDAGEYEVTVKLDGSSMTVFHNQGETGVCSRNLELHETEGNTFWKVAHRNDIPARLSVYGKNIAVQGELIGEGIQGNPEKILGHDFYVFDVFDIDRQTYLSPTERHEVCGLLGLKHVPILHYKATLPASVDHALAIAEGQSLNPNAKREGLVFKRHDGQRSFKAISNSYLMAEQ
ncbi:MAG: RNA ligase (ATP) [Xanthomonadales bacterium]|nr:RNA ligase (ATP) [Xanthomonadales bacterium]